MTISTSASKVVALGNGITVAFSFSFLIPQSGEEQVIFTDALGNQTVLSNTLYALIGFGNPAGGTVTYPLSGSPIPTGTSLTIARVLPLVQGTTISNQGAFYPQVVEGALDYEMMVSQQLNQTLKQAILAPIVDQNPMAQLPAAAQRAGKYLAFDSNGNPIATGAASTINSLTLNGATSGTLVVAPQAVASGTLNFPNGNDTLVARNTTDTLTNKTINGANNTITNVSLATGVTGTLPIGSGGTGQGTAPAGFDALSPTTTRGDVIFRNATTNARLAASTAGYLLQTNGASADPTWVGFLQSGTSAVTRTWQAKAQEWISVKDFGAAGDGVTNDSTAIAAAETYRASVGGYLYFPAGTYLYAGQAINRANGGGWIGQGECKFIPTANSVLLMDLSGAVIGATAPVSFTIQGIHFATNAKTSIIAIRETVPYYTTIENCKFTGDLQYSCLMIGNSAAAQSGWVNISNIAQYGAGTWSFQSFDNTHYIFNINVTNFVQNGSGASVWAQQQLFNLQRAVTVQLNNIAAGSLDGGASGVSLLGDCQGVFLNNVIVAWPIYGCIAQAWTDGVIPSYVYMTNIGWDQPTNTGMLIHGRTWLLRNVNATNGYLKSSTGPGILIKSDATDIDISGCLTSYMNNDGLQIETGAAKVRVSGLTSENNNHIAGTNYDLNLNACSFTDVKLFGKNIIGTAGVNATGQRIVNGLTSPVVSLNNTPVSTGANTTATDLMTYSIPANALQIGQRVRIKAWGTTAANANTKTGRLWFGSTNMGGWSSTLNAVGWEINGEVDITGSNAQSWNRNVLGLNTITQNLSGTAAEVMTSAIVAKFQGQNGVATAGDITCNGLEVEILD